VSLGPLLALPVEVLVASFLLSMLGAASPVGLPGGRTAFFVLSHTAFALFLIVGPSAVVVTLAAAIVVAFAHVVARRSWRRAREVVTQSAFMALGIFVAHAANRLASGSYPLAIDSLARVLLACAVLALAFVTFTGVKEGLARLRAGGRRAVEPSDVLEEGVTLYSRAALIAGPMHILELALYETAGPWTWIAAMGCVPAFNAAIPFEVRRVERLRQLLAERAARERVEALAEVTTRVAHQMRHQLGLIGLSLHRIDAELESTGLTNTAVVREELENLSRAQDELRSVLTTDLQGAMASTHAVRWETVVRAPLARVGLLARERGVAIIDDFRDMPEGEPRHARRLEQAWFNVVENAIAAARSRVSLSLRADAGMLMLSAEDDGPGMSDGVIARATEPFFTTKPGGTGMGLAIARAVAEDLGGEVVIERLDPGLRVSLRLPGGARKVRDGGPGRERPGAP
jgi:signal transduction histidine kinase